MSIGTGNSVLLILMFANYVAHAATGPISPEVTPAPTPSVEPVVTVTDEKCSISNTRSCRDSQTLAACLINTSSSNAFKDLSLLVQNNGEEPLKANVVIVDIHITLPPILLSEHQAKMIKIQANIEGSPYIILNAGNGKCIIRVGSMDLDNAGHKQYLAYLSPMYGAYFLFFAILIAGGVWGCCKFGKNENGVDGIRYQEVEMEQPSARDEEMAANNWSDNWEQEEEEEEEEEKSPHKDDKENVDANGHIDSDQWENDWRDLD